MHNLSTEIFSDINKENAIVQITNKGDRYYHSHNFYELFYITNGTIKHSLNSETDELSMGDVVFLRPGDIHCFLREPDNACAHRDLALTVPFYAKVKIDIETLNKLETELQKIGNADAEKNPSFYFALAELFKAKRNADLQGKQRDSAPEWILGLIAKLEMPEFFCLAPSEIFAELNYSKEYVSRTFRKVTGKTLTDYMNQRKLSLASVLIQNTDKSIERICFECGYNNVSYFYRTFRQTFGKTPHELRKITSK